MREGVGFTELELQTVVSSPVSAGIEPALSESGASAPTTEPSLQLPQISSKMFSSLSTKIVHVHLKWRDKNREGEDAGIMDAIRRKDLED